MSPSVHTVLNNFVVELLHARPTPNRPPSVYTFDNPRQGWVYFRSKMVPSRKQTASISLERGSNRDTIILHGPGEPSVQEAMRHLPKGSHTIRISVNDKAQIASLIVRAIPEIVYANYPADPHLKDYGSYDWGFLDRIGMLSCANVIVTGRPGEWTRAWIEQGKRVIQQIGVPGLDASEEVTTESAFEYWSQSKGWTSPWSSGVIADEFLPGRDEKMPAWSKAIRRMTSHRKDRVFYPYLGGDPSGLRSVVSSLADTPCRFAYERYLKEQPTEEEAKDVLDSRLKQDILEFERWIPNFPERLIIVLGLLCGPPESLNTNPSASYKVYMDMQFHKIATDPAFKGIYGIEEYLSSYADEEYLRWAVRLYRHYCIEGSTHRLSHDPYLLDHIDNPDFRRGLDGWDVEPAEEGSIGTRRMKGYGWLEGRYPRDDEGDTFLWMKRSNKGPNKVSQIVRNLEPGRVYSLKMYVGDHLQLTRSRRHTLSIDISPAEMLAHRSFQGIFANCYSHHIPEYGDRNTYFNFLRRVFRAKDIHARLTISDWVLDDEPRAPIGQEIILNFVEIEPFFTGDDD